MKIDMARQHWPILRKLGNDLANRVRSFIVIGIDGEGVLITTEDGQGYWLGKMYFGVGESRTVNEPTPLGVPDLVCMAQSNIQILLLNKQGEIYKMGINENGPLGEKIEDEEIHFLPQLISIPQKLTSVRCGVFHNLALSEDGKVWAWGYNDSSQVGRRGLPNSILSAHQIPELNLHRVIAVECGGWHSLALTDQGEVYAWGENSDRQLGEENISYEYPPIRIITSSPVKSMAAGLTHTLLLTESGEVYTCGRNEFGQLGLPTTTRFSASLVKVAGLPRISKIASQFITDLSIAITSDQRCFFWGVLRDGTLISTPRELPSFYSTVESPFSFYSTYRNTPHSVQVSETPPNRLSARMSRMFDNPETSDIQFVVEQRIIHGHRIILSNSSDYFGQMFSERWLAPVEPEHSIVKVTISDHSYQAFHAFLCFLYTDYFELHYDFLPEMFELARLYLVPELQRLCLLRMRTSFTPTTCCLYYPLTHRHSLPELEDFQGDIVKFASTRMSEITSTAEYQSMESDLCDNLTNAVQLINENL